MSTRTACFRDMDFKSVQETWYNAFWQRLSENCQAEGLEERFSFGRVDNF